MESHALRETSTSQPDADQAPEASQAASKTGHHPQPVTAATIADSDGFLGSLARFSNFWSSNRQSAIEKTPGFIVNNSSNLLGAAHVATEMMMFKASSKDARLIKNPSNPINWVKEPIHTVFVDTFNRSRSEKIPFKELFLEGNPFRNVYKRVTDTAAATERVRATQRQQGIALKDMKFSNPWQTRSTLAGLVVWGLSTLIPEAREDEAEIERMAVKQQVNPVGYALERLKQAVWVPEWPQHKRQMIGLGIMASGVCSTIGSWRGRAVDKVTGLQGYTFNKSYLGTSLFTLSASLPLLFASDDRRGYGGFGALMMGRLFFLPSSIYKKYKDSEPGRQWYTMGTVSFQAENLAQNLIGGAEKLPDGTVVDHTEIRKQAKEKARELKQGKASSSVHADGADVALVSDNDNALPDTHVSHVNRAGLAQAPLPQAAIGG